MKYNTRKKYILVLILIMCFLFLMGCTNRYSAERIIDSTNIPDCVMDEIKETTFERGVYYFSETFTGSDEFLIFCGGEGYIDAYDVDITKIEYNALINTASPPDKPIYGFYQVDYEEFHVNKNYDYGIISNYPIVIYKISGDIGELAWPVFTSSQKLTLQKWWGSSDTVQECKFAAGSVMNFDGSTVPDGVVDIFMSRPNLDNHTNGQNVDLYRKYFKVDVQNPYAISIESLTWSQDPGGGYSCYVVISKKVIEKPVYNEGENYYILLEIDLLHDRARLSKCLQLDDHLGWKLE